jgi:hypothetical protein
LSLCRILLYKLGYIWTCVVLGVDRLRVGFESDSSSLGLLYNERAPHVVTYVDLIAIGAQGEPAACAGDQGGRCCFINREERP